jgi:hypothetical protein
MDDTTHPTGAQTAVAALLNEHGIAAQLGHLLELAYLRGARDTLAQLRQREDELRHERAHHWDDTPATDEPARIRACRDAGVNPWGEL